MNGSGEGWYLLLGLIYGVPVLVIVVPVLILVPVAFVVRAILLRRAEQFAEDRHGIRGSMDRGD